jgi:hypothetical protein
MSVASLYVTECGKLMCFRYYSGLNLTCLAQSEPFTLLSNSSVKPSAAKGTLPRSSPILNFKKKSVVSMGCETPQSAVKRREFPSSDVMRVRGSKIFANNSSESDSEVETSAKYRKQRSVKLLKKKAALVHGPDKRLLNGYPPHVNGGGGEESDNSDTSLIPSHKLQTWNSHESAQKTLDREDHSHVVKEPMNLCDTVDYYPIWTKSPLPSRSRYGYLLVGSICVEIMQIIN